MGKPNFRDQRTTGLKDNTRWTKNVWSLYKIIEYQDWVASNPRPVYSGLTLDCADFALYLLIVFSSSKNLPVAFEGKWKESRGCSSFIKRGILRLSRTNEKSKYRQFKNTVLKRIEALEIVLPKYRNTLPTRLNAIFPGDLLAHKAHVQVVLKPSSMIEVNSKKVRVTEILQGNLGWLGATKIQHRAWDISKKPLQSGLRNYYECYDHQNECKWRFLKQEFFALNGRRWNFNKFNSAYGINKPFDRHRPIPQPGPEGGLRVA